MVKIQNLAKSYPSGKGKLDVLKGASFGVHEGEMLGIIGQSGVGKTTLLHIIGTLDRPDNGSIYFEDKNILKMKNRGIIRFRNEQIGFVFQFYHLLPEFTALENIMMPLLIRGYNRYMARERATKILEDVGLFDRREHKPSELSGGEQQRIAIGRSIVCRPKLLLADEPTGNLDASTSDRITELLFSVARKENLTGIIVTHNQNIVRNCDRILLLHDGKLIEYPKPDASEGEKE